MSMDIAVGDAAKLTIAGWKVVDGCLQVRPSGGTEDRVLRCVCGRSHWIIETRVHGAAGVLAVKCHGCGRAADLPLAAPMTHRIA